MNLYLATGNAHKLAEVAAILAAAGVEATVLPPSALGGMPVVDENADTFLGNARKKALALAAHLPRAATDWVIADDSGLCVDALDGAPGVRSARFAGDGASDAANTAKLLLQLAPVPNELRTAAFHCVIVAANAIGATVAFEGSCPGRLLSAARGDGGFGYDPLFVPDGQTATFAELPPEIKNRLSHRAHALAGLIHWLREGCIVPPPPGANRGRVST